MTIKNLSLAAILGASMLGPSGAALVSAQDKVNLFKIVTVRDETVIGLTSADLDSIGGERDAGAVARVIAARGELSAWQYAVRKAGNGDLQFAPLRRVGLLAHGSLRVEPYVSQLPSSRPERHPAVVGDVHQVASSRAEGLKTMNRLAKISAFAALLASTVPTAAQSCRPLRAESDVAGVRIADVDSSRRVFGDSSKLNHFQEKDAHGADQDFPYVRFLSRDGQQEARFYIHYGDSVGSYNEIEVMPVTRAGRDAMRLQASSLATERGVKLGMRRTELIRLLGPCHAKERRAGGLERISYKIEDEGHALLKRSGLPSYYARYDFKGGKLVQFRIGFDYP